MASASAKQCDDTVMKQCDDTVMKQCDDTVMKQCDETHTNKNKMRVTMAVMDHEELDMWMHDDG